MIVDSQESDVENSNANQVQKLQDSYRDKKEIKGGHTTLEEKVQHMRQIKQSKQKIQEEKLSN